MEDAGKGTQAQNEMNASGNNRWAQLIRSLKGRLQKSKTDKENESHADRAARRTATATIWMAFFTIILSVVSIGTLLVLKKQLGEMHDGGVDTHNLAKSAGDQATWTQRLATSANTESGHMKDLADHMKDQADRTKDLSDRALSQTKATNRLAAATEKANNNAIENDRPWVGIALRIDVPEAGKIPTIDASMINTGKRPAKITLMELNGGFYTIFPKNPPYPTMGPPSTDILMPGFPTSNKYKMSPEAWTQRNMDVLTAGSLTLYEYVNVEYLDIRTGKSHYTHACWKYIPGNKTLASGFYSCTEYQDAN